MLAVSTPMKSIWAIPGDARAMSATQKQQLAGLLDMSARELDGKVAAEKTFVFIKRQVPPETAERVPALKLPGMHQEKEYRRYYPTGDMTAQDVYKRQLPPCLPPSSRGRILEASASCSVTSAPAAKKRC